MAQISEVISNGVLTEWKTIENGDTTLNVGVGTIVPAGTFSLIRKELIAGDEAVTTANGRALQAVFAQTPVGDVKATLLRQAAALCEGVGITIDNAAHTITLSSAIKFTQMPTDYDEKKRAYKTPLRAEKA